VNPTTKTLLRHQMRTIVVGDFVLKFFRVLFVVVTQLCLFSDKEAKKAAKAAAKQAKADAKAKAAADREGN
jgi:hypothetical protein